MSIFFKFGVEAGDPMKVNCDGMDMNLGELKLAIKDIKGIKNVTDFDLQVRDLHSNICIDTLTFPLSGGEQSEQGDLH
mgnify:FL=1